MSDRLAPPQVDRPIETDDSGHSDVNIWYGTGKRKKRSFPEKGIASLYRCIPDNHEGRTKGGTGSDICLFFARGCCHLGHRCNRRHRVPKVDDFQLEDVQRDCFGRMRLSESNSDVDDQNGPGCVLKENLTLFVGDFGGDCSEEELRQHFAPFGPIVQV